MDHYIFPEIEDEVKKELEITEEEAFMFGKSWKAYTERISPIGVLKR